MSKELFVKYSYTNVTYNHVKTGYLSHAEKHLEVISNWEILVVEEDENSTEVLFEFEYKLMEKYIGSVVKIESVSRI